jgi:sporadic carbohydrate cluster 2OG-Fe(II) oxygenase
MANFLNNEEKKISKEFLDKGYIIRKASNKKSLEYITLLIKKSIQSVLKNKNRSIDLDKFHNLVSVEELNQLRLGVINNMNQDKNLKFHYFNLARDLIYILAGNELMMQKNINLSIQYPKDSNSLLPIHSDVWSGDSSFEINLWLPLVNCYGTKSMYILEQKHNKSFLEFMKKNNLSSSKEIFKVLKNKVKWLKLDYGEFLIFNQGLPHGNVINTENESRWSMNCRFKSFFSPYGDKKIGEFFLPITTRAITEVGMNFEYPFKKQ